MKKISRIMSVVLAAVMLMSIMAIAPVTTQAASVPAWKTAYVNYIKTHKINEGGGYGLVDADKNGIPELLFSHGAGSMGGGSISTFYNNKIQTVNVSAFYGVLYLQNNKYYFSSGRQGMYSDRVYRVNGGFGLSFDGKRTAVNYFDFDMDNPYDFTYQYRLNGSSNYISTNYYNYIINLGSVFDESKATYIDLSKCYNYNQIISAINNYVPAPAAPALSIANNSAGIYATWNRVANASKYNVFYKKASDSGWSSFQTTNNSCQLKGLSSGTLYYVQVQGVTSTGVKGAYSRYKGMTYIAQPTITSLTYNGSNTLKWSKVSGANKYQVARLKSGDKAYTYFTTANTSFTESAVGGVAYTYQVRAMYATTNSGTAYGAWSSGKSVATLVAPTVTLSNQPNAVLVKWNSIKGAKKYIVYFKSAKDSAWKTATSTNTSLPISGVASGTTYYVQVRPIGSTVNGPFSAAKNITFITTAKPTLKLSNKSNGIRAEWNSFKGATSYKVFYKTASASSWSNVTTSNTYYPLLNLTKGVKYYVQVQPNFGSYKGAYSSVASLVYQPVVPVNPKPVSSSYVLNTNSRVFHRSDCASVSRMNESNKYYYNGTRQQVIGMGYSPCQNCNP